MLSWFDDVRAWFKHSVTILWARIQYVVGIVGAGLVAVFSGYDFSQLAGMDAKTAFKLLAWSAVAGIITELARRRTL